MTPRQQNGNTACYFGPTTTFSLGFVRSELLVTRRMGGMNRS
jgi:hypothetical protein